MGQLIANRTNRNGTGRYAEVVDGRVVGFELVKTHQGRLQTHHHLVYKGDMTTPSVRPYDIRIAHKAIQMVGPIDLGADTPDGQLFAKGWVRLT